MDNLLLKAYIENNCTDAQKREVERWLAGSGDTEECTALLRDIWNNEPSAVSELEMEVAVHHLLQRMELSEKRTSPWRLRRLFTTTHLYKAAAILLLPLVSSLLTWYIISSSTNEKSYVANVEYTVLPGERKEIILPDDTRVCLNSGSVLICPETFAGKTRTVYLMGEGYFEVAKNKEKPFVVSTALMAVEALGTEFAISAYQQDNSVRTTLAEGSVRLSSSFNDSVPSVNLVPSQQSYYTPGMTRFAVTKVDTEQYLAWKDGLLIFNKMPFEEVIDRLEKQFGIEIKYNNTQFRTDNITARFIYQESLPEVLRVLAKIAHFDYSLQNNVMYLYKLNQLEKS